MDRPPVRRARRDRGDRRGGRSICPRRDTLLGRSRSVTAPGPTNGLLDVAGLSIGQHTLSGEGWLSGVTAILSDDGAMTAGVDVRGGGPGTRETDLLDPTATVEQVTAIVVSGG